MDMDIIVKSNFNDFRKQFGYDEGISECDAFELFVIFGILAKHLKNETITPELLNNVKIGNGGDWGIDGLIIIINGKVVLTEEEISDLVQTNGEISVSFILIQAKTSPNFKVNELGQTLDGAENILRDVLGESELPTSNEELTTYRKIVKQVYENSAKFGKNPSMLVYYATCGKYNAQDDFIAKIKKTKDFVKGTGLIQEDAFKCTMLGKDEIITNYKDTKTKLEATIKVEHKISLPDVKDIEESYLCLLPFRELKKLIVDEEGKMIEYIFHDNVRAFQGENLVNQGISNSLRNGEIALFTAMNNGITIISKSIKTTGNTIHLTDYQIVNGCQTCNVLQQNMDIDGIDDLKLSVKLISSEDKKIRDKIIVGNNSQTEVKREQLVSLLKVQDKIEDYYNAQNQFEKLYYERRSKQYRGTGIPQDKVITIPCQIQSYIAMIMGEPEQIRGYYGRIVEQFKQDGKAVFSEDANPALYYTSALAYFKLEKMFTLGIIDRKYKKIKFHVLLAFRLFCEKNPMPNPNDKTVQEYCNYLCTKLCDSENCKTAFLGAIGLIERTLNRPPQDKDRMDKNFTNNLKYKAIELSSYMKAKK